MIKNKKIKKKNILNFILLPNKKKILLKIIKINFFQN